jgi:phosphatidylserine decarboxylase
MNYIHKEGRFILISLFIFLSLILVLLLVLHSPVWLLASAAFILTIVFLMVASFFRNPTRLIECTANCIVAPADGKVVVIEETMENEYFKDKRIQVSIFMSPANVHVNRMPLTGIISYVKYHTGKYLVAWHPKSSTENERNTVVVNYNGIEILMRQIAGALAKRIINYVKAGDSVIQGQDFGFIKFGSRVDLFLPIGTVIEVKLNEVVKGNKTIIARL